ncbi:MAG: hypothetical protein HY401_08040 [Elusimicrobia bacterium]|nr:hypothetical protein [Elusimicrobiota bacterium]
MKTHHPELARGRWQTFSLAQQLGNVGSEVSRAMRWQAKDQKLFDGALVRALELFDLTIEDSRWRGRLKELLRVREFLCGAWLGGAEHGVSLQSLNRYFFDFALAARGNKPV